MRLVLKLRRPTSAARFGATLSPFPSPPAPGAAAEAGLFSRPPDALAASSRARACCSQQSHPQGAAEDTLGLAVRVVVVRAPLLLTPP